MHWSDDLPYHGNGGHGALVSRADGLQSALDRAGRKNDKLRKAVELTMAAIEEQRVNPSKSLVGAHEALEKAFNYNGDYE